MPARYPPARPGAGRPGLLVFLAAAFGLAWPVQVGLALLARGTGLSASPWLVLPVAFLLMWPPALGAYLARRVEGAGFADAGLRWPAWGYVILAWFMPALLTLVSTAYSLAIYPLDAELSTLRSMLAQTGREVPVPVEILLAGQVAAGLTVAVLINSLFAFGEELGWRGYLLPRLMGRLGTWPGIILHGAVWGLWHGPLILLASYNYPGHPPPYLPGVFLFTVFCILLGIIFAWLRLASGSVLPPTIAHGAFNAIGGLPLLLLKGVDPAVAGPLWSPVGWVVLGLTAVILYRAQNPLKSAV